jgi:hypothetical protein
MLAGVLAELMVALKVASSGDLLGLGQAVH